MGQITGKIEITLDDAGLVQVACGGPALQSKTTLYGLLAVAQEVLRDAATPKVQPAGVTEVSRLFGRTT